MRRSVIFALLIATTPAFADDDSACAEGIAMIRDALAKGPPPASVAKLRQSLRAAEREQGEAEYDECLDAVGDAKRVLAR